MLKLPYDRQVQSRLQVYSRATTCSLFKISFCSNMQSDNRSNMCHNSRLDSEQLKIEKKKKKKKIHNLAGETCDEASANNREASERKRIQPPLHLLLFLLIIHRVTLHRVEQVNHKQTKQQDSIIPATEEDSATACLGFAHSEAVTQCSHLVTIQQRNDMNDNMEQGLTLLH